MKLIAIILISILPFEVYRTIIYKEQLSESQQIYIKELSNVTDGFLESINKVNATLESMDRRLIKLEVN